MELSMFNASVEQSLDWISKVIQNDVTLTIAFKPENQAYSLTLRDKSKDWQQDVPLSVWHSDLWKALKAMAYALGTRWEGYPQDHPAQNGAFTDLW